MSKIRRHTGVEMLEHWSIAISGIILIFTGLGCLPIYKRYFITDIPGFAWTGNFFTVTQVHYWAALVFCMAVFFHLFSHGVSKQWGLLPKKGDIKNSFKVILSAFGIGHEPPSEKYLPEQRVAYIGIGFIVLTLIFSGIIKVLKNLQWIVLSPTAETINTLIHTAFGMFFLLAFLVHIAFVLFFKDNRHLLKGMLTGWVSEEYVKRRHSIWYEEITVKNKSDFS
ncbi:MAG: cytochrome b/b6 domain-containing protein [Thermodesulfovibrionales bacterium]|nr:cytochrome b/b6 domain-containing protein [Thermodesulfovibrionales bacterium]